MGGANSGNTQIERVKVIGDGVSDDNELRVSPFVQWEVLSVVILAVLCLIGFCGYGLILRKRGIGRRERGDGMERVHTEEDVDGGDDSDSMEDGERTNVQSDSVRRTAMFERMRNQKETAQILEVEESTSSEDSEAELTFSLSVSYLNS